MSGQPCHFASANRARASRAIRRCLQPMSDLRSRMRVLESPKQSSRARRLSADERILSGNEWVLSGYEWVLSPLDKVLRTGSRSAVPVWSAFSGLRKHNHGGRFGDDATHFCSVDVRAEPSHFLSFFISISTAAFPGDVDVRALNTKENMRMNYLEPTTASALAEAARPRSMHEWAMASAIAEASRPRSPLEQIIAEHARPRTVLEMTIAEFAKEPSPAAKLNTMARDYEAKRTADALAGLVQTIPVRQALEAEIALPILAD